MPHILGRITFYKLNIKETRYVVMYPDGIYFIDGVIRAIVYPLKEAFAHYMYQNNILALSTISYTTD